MLNRRTLKIEEPIHAVFYKFSLNVDRLREKEDQRDWITSNSHQPLEGTSKQLEENSRKEDKDNQVRLDMS